MNNKEPKLGDLWIVDFWSTTTVMPLNDLAFLGPCLVVEFKKDDPETVLLSQRGIICATTSSLLQTALLFSRDIDSTTLSREHLRVLSWIVKEKMSGKVLMKRTATWEENEIDDVVWDLCAFGLVHHHATLRAFMTVPDHLWTATELGRSVITQRQQQKR